MNIITNNITNYSMQNHIMNNINIDMNSDMNDENNWLNILDETDKCMTDGIENIKICENSFIRKMIIKDKKEHKNKTIDVNDKLIKFDNIKIINDIDLLAKSSMLAKNLKFQLNKKYDNNYFTNNATNNDYADENNEHDTNININIIHTNSNQDKFIKWLISILEYLRDVTFELSLRNHQKTITKIKKKIGVISRNSYKFCEYGHACRFNYGKEQKCYAQHFVYNMVHHDIVEILEYILFISSIGSIDFSEIKISINTMTFVINHMHEELMQLRSTRPIIYTNYEKRLYKPNTKNNIKDKNYHK